MTAEARPRGSWLQGESLVGTKVGDLEVVAPAKRPDDADVKIRGTWWLCKCRCGGEKVLPRQYIVQRNVLSCGCRKRRKAEERRKAWELGIEKKPRRVRDETKKAQLPFGCMVYKSKCPNCKKEFERLSQEWAYKRFVGTHLKYYCSWKCFRA